MSPIHTAESAAGTGIDLTGGQLGLVAGVAFIAAFALLVAGYLVREVLAASQGGPKMIEVGAAVQEGAAAYLRRQFKTLAGFVVVIPFVLLALPAEDVGARVGRSVFFVVGALFSALVGFVGMSLATRANTRTAAAANERGEKAALRLAFRTGGVVGMFTVGLGLLGAAVVVLLFRDTAPQVLEGFGFGAALLAMFMRVGGGIFTKAADVGADLVGKVEKGIPEDDPRNAATIADNVGDNVGDCAGMAADLFESYAVTLVAALILGVKAFGEQGLVFPLLIPAVGVITAVIGIFAVAPRAKDRNGMAAINRGFFISAVISAIGVVIVALVYLPSSFADFDGLAGAVPDGNPRVIAISAVLIGIVLAAAIQLLTGYFTETARKPVRGVVEASTTGPATNILAGISVGLESAVYSAVLIGAAVFGAYLLGSGSVVVALFAVALAGTGLLTTVGVIVSMDTFGPVSDNAQGIAEMSGEVTEEGAAILTSLDAVGNTTKAITKGIAIATAVFAATALFGSFTDTISTALAEAGVLPDAGRGVVGGLNVAYPDALVGLILGAAVVFLFSGLAISAVGRAAGRVVREVRNQFRDHPGIMDGTEKPNYGAVVDICTRDSLRELITPGTLAVMAPIAVGFGLGYPPLGAYLAGAIAGGVLMAVFLSNSGGAWDNAKKLVEDGAHGGKGSEVHAATVIGDTVGDPFKDTAGPSINPLIKVMNLVSLLIAPTVVKFSVGEDKNTWLRILIALAAVAVIAAVIVISKRRGSDLDAAPAGDGVATPPSNVTVGGSSSAVTPNSATADQVNV
ncbi:sodium-translocating pyrophosphatase [Frankia sp. CNm7]|uniref:K(+)-insensitive pyrophosphate-energized proton pump n=1 Tax=Frankia nepalensis TaxID=1836974 RepID=A0A937RUN0_9ACTN|nr:sodium-translocating pyrophosphatase [Frankia nepalensis]MBL7496257.1 sodium-translocating pyrophosphatase [Frankia nepalensis]MBL7514921.1 sodium-translocating pyrophosphatase [Frankia nepalensis]MBL7523370.1 sodium-translocating pyrophosphatase [Frankia nepalensis]MBL7633143.1 sodium-translocating pyrophosphatase [Frankia nepalensis]